MIELRTGRKLKRTDEAVAYGILADTAEELIERFGLPAYCVASALQLVKWDTRTYAKRKLFEMSKKYHIEESEAMKC